MPNDTRDSLVEEISNGYCLSVSTAVAALTQTFPLAQAFRIRIGKITVKQSVY
ncbi:hypothetical protein HUN01_09105 [Nostoc edaphicum CCNP1411]|uniref:Uncharacterized protein n=1 Tax=Nostoc edaphicum CCNP1411 TaxID=1472755 RepID=A0A7D7LDC3_9NOSO|nr:hypothetical protein [Nostoc edaphicum]QMS87732.1 hypothetical protein HUN01_09105 [Nostoc edaphicum CCNP1411]